MECGKTRSALAGTDVARKEAQVITCTVLEDISHADASRSEAEKVVNAGRDGMNNPAVRAFVVVRKSTFRLVLESVAMRTLPSEDIVGF